VRRPEGPPLTRWPRAGQLRAEEDGCALYRCSVTHGAALITVPCACGPACDGRASPRLSPALTPGQRRRRRRLES
jgi:hypothetical protein